MGNFTINSWNSMICIITEFAPDFSIYMRLFHGHVCIFNGINLILKEREKCK